MTLRGEGKNKFLPPFDKDKAKKFLAILEPLQKSGLTVKGVIHYTNEILQRPSYIRKYEMFLFQSILDAISKM